MCTVELITFTTIKRIIGRKRLITKAKTISELIESLVINYGEIINEELFEDRNKLKKHYRIVVNGRNINLLKGFQTELNNEDIVAIMPAIAGG